MNALNKVDLTIPSGEMVAIQGPIGGKSTPLQILGALDRPTSGSVTFCPHNPSKAGEHAVARIRASEIRFVVQSFNLIITPSAAENVETGFASNELPRSKRRCRSLAALESVGLTERADHIPGELSGGQQQRAAIARALVKEPTVLLANEPTGTLNESTATTSCTFSRVSGATAASPS